MITIDFAHSVGAKKTENLTRERFDQTLDSAYVKSLCEDIAAETDHKRLQ